MCPLKENVDLFPNSSILIKGMLEIMTDTL